MQRAARGTLSQLLWSLFIRYLLLYSIEYYTLRIGIPEVHFVISGQAELLQPLAFMYHILPIELMKHKTSLASASGTLYRPITLPRLYPNETCTTEVKRNVAKCFNSVSADFCRPALKFLSNASWFGIICSPPEPCLPSVSEKEFSVEVNSLDPRSSTSHSLTSSDSARRKHAVV
jgi:hypothetical protein